MHEIVDINKKIEHIFVDQRKMHCTSLIRKNFTVNPQYRLLDGLHNDNARFSFVADCFDWPWFCI